MSTDDDLVCCGDAIISLDRVWQVYPVGDGYQVELRPPSGDTDEPIVTYLDRADGAALVQAYNAYHRRQAAETRE